MVSAGAAGATAAAVFLRVRLRTVSHLRPGQQRDEAKDEDDIIVVFVVNELSTVYCTVLYSNKSRLDLFMEHQIREVINLES